MVHWAPAPTAVYLISKLVCSVVRSTEKQTKIKPVALSSLQFDCSPDPALVQAEAPARASRLASRSWPLVFSEGEKKRNETNVDLTREIE